MPKVTQEACGNASIEPGPPSPALFLFSHLIRPAEPLDPASRARGFGSRGLCPLVFLQITLHFASSFYIIFDFASLSSLPPTPASFILVFPFLSSLLSWLHGQTPDMLLAFILMVRSCKAQYFTSIACVIG